MAKDAPRTEAAPFGWLPPAAYDVSLKFTVQDVNSPMHWDVAGISYVWPPLGQTVQHVSGTKTEENKKEIFNNDNWKKYFISPGTRMFPIRPDSSRERQPVQRWIGGFSPAGSQPPWNGVYIDLPNDLDALRWRNQPPSSTSLPQRSAQASGSTSAASLNAPDAVLADESLTPPHAEAAARPRRRGEAQPARSKRNKVQVLIDMDFEAQNEGGGKGGGKGSAPEWPWGEPTLAKKTALARTRDRLQRLRMESSEEIPLDCKFLGRTPEGLPIRYDSHHAGTEDSFQRHPQRGNPQQLESLHNFVYYHQPWCDKSALAYKISMDQGCHDYTYEEKRAAAQRMYAEFVDAVEDQQKAWKTLNCYPKQMSLY